MISRFARGRVGPLVIMLGVACLSFTLGTYAKDLNATDLKHDENSADSLLGDNFPLSTFIHALEHDFRTDLGGHLGPALQAANKLSDELKAGRQWCRSVMTK